MHSLLRRITFHCMVVGCMLASTTPQAQVHASQRPKKVVANEITSSHLESILQAGPHAMIRAFLVEPAYAAKRFLGFKVVARTPHPSIGENALVSVGDIVVAANGIRLETPAQFMAAWRKLREQNTFSVDVIRKQQRIQYRWSLKSEKRPK